MNWTSEGERKEWFAEGTNGSNENGELSRTWGNDKHELTDDRHVLICMGKQGTLGKG